MAKKISLGLLRTFETSARLLSFTQAAVELNLTQAAVSKQVKALEDQLGALLFRRSAHGIELTEKGHRYWLDTRDKITQLDKVTTQLFTTKNPRSLKIHCNISYSFFVLTSYVSGFKQSYPDIAIELIHDVWHKEQEQRKNTNADIEISYLTIAESKGAKLLHRDMLFPVVSAELTDAEIEDLPLIHVLGYYQEWSWWQQEFADKCTAENLTVWRPKWMSQKQSLGSGLKEAKSNFRVDSSLLAYELAAQGAGVALGRSCLVQGFIDSGRLRPIFADSNIEAPEGFHIQFTEPGIAHKPAQWFMEFVNNSAGTIG